MVYRERPPYPGTGFQDQLLRLISRFMCRFKTSNTLLRDWWVLPLGQGGLGLAPIPNTVRSFQVFMMCKMILIGRLTPNVTSLADPFIRLFDQAISSWGEHFDILYTPVTTSPDYAISRRLWIGLALGLTGTMCFPLGTPAFGESSQTID
ncbi:uncharacterized protein PHALS_11272 [Plasmopara halstedii]|uniref:Uncharacterized protein n=1 Tax=Plasmopara halstedii TaxID=4781 RepID=A0A0N7L5C7_PLAHL|nr:uncharacterized protein PHALS_11272 [Plasmopara halstedii]CEG41107.1 hypothetical protein PHALS_11272 [Plasmopara halstedii]|eukprot:XP_024577476.1 hypothetical protein PHALS_11272 [Plasmopara halstedii]